MPSLLAERLRRARHEQFVGRESHLALFCKALHAEVLPFHLLYLHGPGGVGKTALLQELRYQCMHGLCGDLSPDGAPRGDREAPVPTHYLDARDVEPTPAAFRQALERGRESSADEASAAEDGARSVLMIDTFEALQPLERWFREDFLPQLSQAVLVVVAGRTPPPAAWRAEAGLQALMRVEPLRNLPPAQSRRYLAGRGVPASEREAVIDFACGHPLALSLAADHFDQAPQQTFSPEATPELVSTLLKRFVAEAPSPAHRRALEAIALVRALSEALLDRLLRARPEDEDGDPPAPAPSADAHALFEWLRTLSFVEAGPRGLFPHDVAREALVADLRWRRPRRYEALHRAARRFYTGRLQEAAGAEAHERLLSDYLFLYRDNSVVAPLFARLRQQWQGRAFTARPPRADEWATLRQMTRRHEGAASVALLDHWKDHPAARTTVFCDEDDTPAGFALVLALHDVPEADRARDPAVATACRHLEEHAPLREGEAATLFRFWMDREKHQALSPVQSLISARRVRHYLSTPRLAFSFITCAQPGLWALVFAYADIRRLEDADYDVGDRTFALFGHDWRATPPTRWLEQMAQRNITERAPEEVPPASATPRLVLSREDFAAAVKRALKDFARPDRLRKNPLARAPFLDVVAGADADPGERAQALRELVQEAAERLRGAPREEKFYRALRATYLDPVGTQEEAAEATGTAFSTFRRHLGRGVDHVVDVLWERETSAPSAAVSLDQ